jgi:chemotaxis protein CheX
VDVKYINPFLDSVDQVFKMMLDVEVERAAIKLGTRDTAGSPADDLITSLVQISGRADGFVAMCFPAETALDLARRFLGSAAKELNEEVIDAISELVNMVAGSAKSKFNLDPPPTLAIPTVAQGRNHREHYPEQAKWLEVPFKSAAGSFTMEVTFRPVS